MAAAQQARSRGAHLGKDNPRSVTMKELCLAVFAWLFMKLPAKTIDEYREEFKNAPLGRWATPYEFGPWPTVAWEFYSDGTGKIFEYAGGDDNIMCFEWKTIGERRISLRVTNAGVLQEDGCNPYDEWTDINYDFKEEQHYGPNIVMYETPENEILKFWFHQDYLEYVKPLN
jgi:hypothetical protein